MAIERVHGSYEYVKFNFTLDICSLSEPITLSFSIRERCANFTDCLESRSGSAPIRILQFFNVVLTTLNGIFYLNQKYGTP
jgi:hypothetical protein